MSLKKQAISGIKWTTISSVFNAVIQLAQLAFLARLLSSSDFGLMAIVMVVIGFSRLFIDMGVSNAIIYKQEVTSEQLNTLYWLSVIIGILFFVIVALSAPVISKFYDNKELIPLIRLVGVTFLIKPWGQQSVILLQKNLRFNEIAKTDMVTKFITFIIIVVLAFKNYGVYSLAIGAVLASLLSTIGYLFFGLKLHKPQFRIEFNNLKDFISFGLFQMGERIIQYFSSQFDTILIGKLLGVEILGVYNVAKSLASRPSGIINPIVTKVTFPLMSKFNNDVNKLKTVYLKTINYLSFVNFPTYFLLAILARPVILLLFGDKWLDAVPLVQILSFVFLLRSLNNPSGSLILSMGKANVAFYWNLLKFFLFPISIMIGNYIGIIGIALSLLILQLLLVFPSWKFIVNKSCNASLKEFFLSFSNPFIISTISMIITLALVHLITNSVALLLFGVFIFLSIFILLTIKIQPTLINELKEMH